MKHFFTMSVCLICLLMAAGGCQRKIPPIAPPTELVVPVSTPASGQPTPKQTHQPTDVRAARALDPRAFDQAVADPEDNMFAGPWQGDKLFA